MKAHGMLRDTVRRPALEMVTELGKLVHWLMIAVQELLIPFVNYPSRVLDLLPQAGGTNPKPTRNNNHYQLLS